MTQLMQQTAYGPTVRRRLFLGALARSGGKTSSAVSLLLVDALAAIGFAVGIAGAVASLAAGQRCLQWVGLMLLAGLVRSAVSLSSSLVGATAAREAKFQRRRRIAAAALTRAPSGAALGSMLTATVDEIEALDAYVARFVPVRTAALIAPLIVLGATAVASPISALILSATLIPFITMMAFVGAAAADETKRQFETMDRLSGIFVDRVRALPLILTFQAEKSEATRIGSTASDLAARTLRVLARAFLSSACLEFFAALSVALVAVYAGFSLLGILPFHAPEHLTLARAFFILALAPEFYAPLRRLAAAYHDKQAAETVADRQQPFDDEAAKAVKRRRIFVSEAPTLSFRHVSIRYPDTDRAAVSDFSLDVGRGETVALIGPSGSGKTSLIKLLLGLAPLTAGSLFIDGELLHDGDYVSASFAGQSPLLIEGSLASNIALGDNHTGWRDIRQAAVAAGLGPAVDRRAGGIGTRLDERGGGLSGGEQRRVGIARAIISQSPLMLLDEPTAHLDQDSELALIGTIAAHARGRTVLIATHSRALAAIADRVVELAAMS